MTNWLIGPAVTLAGVFVDSRVLIPFGMFGMLVAVLLAVASIPAICDLRPSKVPRHIDPSK